MSQTLSDEEWTLDGTRQGVSHLCSYGSNCPTSGVQVIFFFDVFMHRFCQCLVCFIAFPLILIVLLLKNYFILFRLYDTNYLGYFVFYFDQLGSSLQLFFKKINEVKMAMNVKFRLQFSSSSTSSMKHHAIDLLNNTKHKVEVMENFYSPSVLTISLISTIS